MTTPENTNEESPVWIKWTPSWVGSHVGGRYTERTFDAESKMPDPQVIMCTCSKCGAKWRGECLSGNVRSHIAHFATVHAHTDPLQAPRVERPGSLRREHK